VTLLFAAIMFFISELCSFLHIDSEAESIGTHMMYRAIKSKSILVWMYNFLFYISAKILGPH
jgi:hypothetical protein